MQTKLSDIVQLTAGKNISRLDKSQEKYSYTQNDFENDLQGVNQEYVSDCIINLMKSKAAPLTKTTSGKCLITNFVLCSFDTEIMDPWYFCYLFNESKEFERQFNMYQQGSIASVRKLNLKNIGDIVINVIDIEKQRKIGKLYKEYVRKNYLVQLQTKNISLFTKEIIRKIEED